MLQVNKLFNIQQRYMQLLGMIEEAEGEITPDIDAALQFTEADMQTEGINVAEVIKVMEYSMEILENEMDRLDGLHIKALRAKDLLKNRLSYAMQQFGIERISSPTITLSFRKSEGIEITEETAIPVAYLEPQPAKVSKTKIKEAIKAGIVVPGAELVQRQNLQIK
jgi:hypothetical protein